MSEQGGNGEFHRADPAYRRRMQQLLVLVVVLGLGALAALNLWLLDARAHLTTADQFHYQRALHTMVAVPSLLLGIGGLLVSAWLFRLARETFAERRWPPSATRTSTDVRIRYLRAADSMAVQVRAGAIALALLSTGLLVFFGWLLWSR